MPLLASDNGAVKAVHHVKTNAGLREIGVVGQEKERASFASFTTTTTSNKERLALTRKY